MKKFFGKHNAIGNTGVKNPTQRLGRIASITEWYRKSKEERAKFAHDKSFEPLEPQDPLGQAYNRILTTATQALFKRIEFHSRNNPKFVKACNKVASFSHKTNSKTVLFLIGKPSSFSSRESMLYRGFSYPPELLSEYNKSIMSEKAKNELKNVKENFNTIASFVKVDKSIVRMGKTVGKNTISLMVMKRGAPYGVSSVEMDNARKFFLENARKNQ